MTFNDNIKNELSSYVYKLESVTYFDSQKSIMQTPSHHSFILFKESIGQIELNGTNYSINEDSVFFSHANNHKKQEIHFTERLQGYHFQFYSLIDQVAGEYKQSPLSCPQKLYTTQHSLLQTKAEEIFNLQDHDKMMANILFQKWIYTVFNELQTGQSLSIEQLIHKSREYINTHYHLEITRDQLAQMTGLNVDYYSRKFKQYFQKSPITYLNDVRLWQAKQRLIQTNEPIRSIAKQVGFTDEFYFSRKFKTKEGYSPTFYINKLKQSRRLASLNHVVTGHSLALGIEPYAAIRNQSFPLTSEIEHTLSIGNEYPDLERLLTVKPELIVRCAPADQKQTNKDELYHHIAPTVTLSFQDSLEKEFRYYGSFT
ncbi:helix-turn-helix domain-containing protein [Alkalicoccobacillus plakortidis]|uniref:Helix-turn-helix domain-containing protein n=1 Tax=Alkalicoccobacillus plakortidis TaxID=444060 RepID=A0ABT0XK67_9BACI|nr:helix-turn-helix domain-containing protein [Alkalicoccobacillus plakortidis]MCM2676296.1 helix-turn-helix domain-containing protein [Alkalicoccobacillus plakortidis]